jgi:hypothetical protein
MLFDYDDDRKAFKPDSDNLTLSEWKRKNIENYLLVPVAWERAVQQNPEALFSQSALELINDFFAEQNLTLPSGKTWRNVSANIFSLVDGKKILFENDKSLFHQIEKETSLKLIREEIALKMKADEIHEDVHLFMNKLIAMTQ